MPPSTAMASRLSLRSSSLAARARAGMASLEAPPWFRNRRTASLRTSTSGSKASNQVLNRRLACECSGKQMLITHRTAPKERRPFH